MCVGDLAFKLLTFWGETLEQHNETASLVFSLLNNASNGKVRKKCSVESTTHSALTRRVNRVSKSSVSFSRSFKCLRFS